MRPRLAVAAAVLAAFAVAATDAAAQRAPLTATGTRIADHPGTVRVVVDFTGGRVHAGQVIASDPRPFGDGRVRLPLIRPGVRTVAAPARAAGVSVAVVQRSGRIVIRLDAASRRFKYVGYQALRSPGAA